MADEKLELAGEELKAEEELEEESEDAKLELREEELKAEEELELWHVAKH